MFNFFNSPMLNSLRRTFRPPTLVTGGDGSPAPFPMSPPGGVPDNAALFGADIGGTPGLFGADIGGVSAVSPPGQGPAQPRKLGLATPFDPNELQPMPHLPDAPKPEMITLEHRTSPKMPEPDAVIGANPDLIRSMAVQPHEATLTGGGGDNAIAETALQNMPSSAQGGTTADAMAAKVRELFRDGNVPTTKDIHEAREGVKSDKFQRLQREFEADKLRNQNEPSVLDKIKAGAEQRGEDARAFVESVEERAKKKDQQFEENADRIKLEADDRAERRAFDEALGKLAEEIELDQKEARKPFESLADVELDIRLEEGLRRAPNMDSAELAKFKEDINGLIMSGSEPSKARHAQKLLTSIRTEGLTPWNAKYFPTKAIAKKLESLEESSSGTLAKLLEGTSTTAGLFSQAKKHPALTRIASKVTGITAVPTAGMTLLEAFRNAKIEEFRKILQKRFEGGDEEADRALRRKDRLR